MTLLTWDEGFSCGVRAIDAEHQAMIGLANQLDALVAADADRHDISAALAALVSALSAHVRHVDALARRHGFTAGDATADAEAFLNVIRDVKAVFEQHGTLNPQTLDFVQSLVLQHIRETDEPLRTFFRTQQTPRPNDKSYIQWLESFSVGDEVIDTDHKRFVGLVNEIKDTLDAGADRAVVTALLGTFVRHARDHFEREEALLKRLGYPKYAQHKNEHGELNDSIFSLYEQMEAGAESFGRDELLALIKEWIIHHILFVDMKMKSFIEEAKNRH